ncbi:MAG: hypothetical protein DHS20C18_29430 [Saprospiraceae bacterium]|nr:MAG: hypothetical protein DHS20C18_29430 [Saprospiraceae bacterium]
MNCQQDDCAIIETYKDGSIKIMTCIIDEKSENYSYKNYYKTGVLKAKFRLKHGKPDGEKLTYFPSGIIESKYTYKNGLRHGACFEYTKDGKVSSLNYCINDKTIYGKFYKYSTSGESRIENIFDPIIKLQKDTLAHWENKVNFTVQLPIPDSLIDQDYSWFKYDIKPLSLKDSIVLNANHKAKVFYDRTLEGTIELQEPVSQVFYGYLYDEDKRAVFSPFEKLITVLPDSMGVGN